MADLLSFHAKICFTSVGFLIVDRQVLLVKHKKLGIWLAPGGHLEANELPHQSAERECFEESGVAVKAISAIPMLPGTASQYVPHPFAMNLHWISEANYRERLKSPHPEQRYQTETWPKGCEQHLVFCYLVVPTGDLKITQNLAETDAIGWFKESEVDSLETTPDIKSEIHLAFSLTTLS